MAKTKDLTTPSVLAFERKLDPSDGLFSAGRWDDISNGTAWPAVTIHEKSVRGTASHRMKASGGNAGKVGMEKESANLQRVDVATLPNDADTLRVRFTLRVLGGAGTPSACNNAAYQAKLRQTVESYVTEQGFSQLSRRYAHNLANGRFLWRNRVGVEQVHVEVARLKNGHAEQTWAFDALGFSLRNFDTATATTADLDALAGTIEHGLSGQGYVLLEVTAYARMGDGQEVYPSQELILDKGDKKGQKSKTLYGIGPDKNQTAALHSQKIGNALRTIDTWYPQDDTMDLGPIAVEPYGSVTNQGKAYRQPKPHRADFYSLLDAWVLKDEAPTNEGDRHFVMATLVRGGVFSNVG